MKENPTYPIPSIESERVEFKSSFQDEVITTLVAFANAKGGSVYVGVGDKGDIKGVSLGKETVQNWINEIKIKTQPSLIPDAEVIEEQGKIIVLLKVKEYPIKPMSFKGKCYRRVGNSNHLMSVSEVAQMHLRTVNSSWDYFWRDRVTVADISVDKVQKVLDMAKARNPNIGVDTVKQFLQKQELVNGDQVSNACYLLFCKEETYHTTIQMGFFASETVIKDDVTLSTDILTEVDEVMDFVRKHINKEIIITGKLENTERWQYPLEGIRELVINMIVHRDYTSGLHSTIKIFPDSIVFFNSGTLPAHITMEKLLADDYVSFPRNLQIAKVFKEIGLIERYGTGIKRVRQLFLNHGLRQPEFKIVQEGFFVRVFASAAVNEGLKQNVTENVTENRASKILDIMRKSPSSTTQQIADILGVTKRTIIRDIEKLRNAQKVTYIGPAKGGYWKVNKED